MDDEHSPYYREPQMTWADFFKGIGRAILLVIAVALVVVILSGCDYEAAQVTESIAQEVDERHALPPQEIAYWRRHERHQRECRGQAYVAQCCDSSFTAYEVTCLNPEEIR